MLTALGELLLPRRCAGCQRPGHVICEQCREVLCRPPYRIDPTVPAHAPVFACGPYSGAHRGVIIAAKERGDVRVRAYIGAVLAAGVEFLVARGDLPEPVTLVPAPTRPRAARLRGGDPVSAYCAHSGVPWRKVLASAPDACDQSTLSASGRRLNLSGRVKLVGSPPSGEIVLVDDVVTTGSTLAASAERLIAARANVVGAIAIAAA